MGRFQQQKHKHSTMKSVKTNKTTLLFFDTATQQHVNAASRQLCENQAKTASLARTKLQRVRVK
jgi:hypothetical protein